MKCKRCNDVSTLTQKCSLVFKKIAVNSECVTHESYIKLISWVVVYVVLIRLKILLGFRFLCAILIPCRNSRSLTISRIHILMTSPNVLNHTKPFGAQKVRSRIRHIPSSTRKVHRKSSEYSGASYFSVCTLFLSIF